MDRLNLILKSILQKPKTSVSEQPQSWITVTLDCAVSPEVLSAMSGQAAGLFLQAMAGQIEGLEIMAYRIETKSHAVVNPQL